jgi:hypothetical protein
MDAGTGDLTGGSTYSVLEVKMHRMNSTMNFSYPHPSDHEKMAEINHNSTHEQFNATVKLCRYNNVAPSHIIIA